MRVHLPQLRLQVLDGLVWLRRARSVASDWRTPTRTSSSSMETTSGTRSRGSERGDSSGGVNGGAASPRDGVVALSAVIGVPEALQPLQELEVVPGGR